MARSLRELLQWLGFATQAGHVLTTVPRHARTITRMLAGQGDVARTLSASRRPEAQPPALPGQAPQRSPTEPAPPASGAAPTRGATPGDREQARATGRLTRAIEALRAVLTRSPRTRTVAEDTAGMTLQERVRRLKKGGRLLGLKQLAQRVPVGTELTEKLQVEESEADEQAERDRQPRRPSLLERAAQIRAAQRVWRFLRAAPARGAQWGAGTAQFFGGGPQAMRVGAAVGGAAGGALTGVGVLVALGVATRALYKLAERTVEAGRELGKFSAVTATAYAQLDYQAVRLQYEIGRDTARSRAAAAKGLYDLREQAKELAKDWEHFKNSLNQTNETLVSWGTAVGDWLMRMSGLRAGREAAEKPGPGQEPFPVQEFLRELKAGKSGGPANRRPGEA